MKLSLYHSVLLLFLLFLLYSSKLSARPITSKQGQEEVNLSGITSEDSLVQIEGSELINLIGSEFCETGDEECFSRRILSEAHLDYIYTQHHNKP
ncbi:hypothetical protein JCGZ_11257 [Jatropha curcas]|uniref:Phytosulfokine n=1 Tax=Jatropha curcas TaxID=180498 RepID=A0A067KRB8_JATCU|nr:hypothetical protein JCGZ_11257 [Jatropha curcas]